MAIDWITTPLASGPIPANTYNCTIGGLSGNSIYEYRAYMVVGGIPYCGDILTINTLSASPLNPQVTTGSAGSVTLSDMIISNNVVDRKGTPEPIVEYGVLYSQDSSFGDASTLIYGNIGLGVKKKSVFGDISTGTTFNETLTLLLQNTTTYYRAFAINSGSNGNAYGYGDIYTEQTLAPTQTLVYLTGTELNMVDTCVCACAKIGTDPPLTGGQSFRLCYTNYGCSVSDGGTRQMRTCSHAEDGTTPIIGSTATSVLFDNYNGHIEDICEQYGYFDVNASNINDYTFFTEACSHAINSEVSNTNCSVICLGSIVNQTGGSFALADETSSYMKVYTVALNCDAGGHIPQVV